MLDAHPEIQMARPVHPEPKFFAEHGDYDKGLDWYEATYFSIDDAVRLRGEKSASYLESEIAPGRIAASYPGARIVAMLRDPVTRAVSNYRYTAANGLEDLPVDEALSFEAEQRAAAGEDGYEIKGVRLASSPYAYLSRGKYVEHLRRYSAAFPTGQIKPLVYESTVGSVEALSGLYRWLGVDDSYVPARLGDPFNPAEGPPANLSPPIAAALARIYAPFNEALAVEYQVDTSAWT